MIDSIELIFRDQALKMWNLDCYHPLRRQEVGHAGDKVVERGYLGQNVVGGDHVRVAMLRDDLSCEFRVEERSKRGNATGASSFCYVCGRLDTQHPLTELDKVLQ